MKFISGYNTDIGIKKATNEDSLLLLHAMTNYGETVFAVICDGMGGLKKGELASAEVITACSAWFKTSFPKLISNGNLNVAGLRSDWVEILEKKDNALTHYGSQNGFNLGTTITCILIYNGTYYICNVGDSRVYMLTDNCYQLTHDHTVVQEKIDSGMMTEEQALYDPQRSVLTQCIGSSAFVNPDFFSGAVQSDTTFMLCCDGFRHVVSPQEFYTYLNPGVLTSEKQINANLTMLTELVKQRGETDNITAIAIKVTM